MVISLKRMWSKKLSRVFDGVYLKVDLFNHTSIAITRKYLGLRKEDLNDIYMNL